MSVQTVWPVWGRLLREPPLQQALCEGAPLPAGGAGLSEEEPDVANAYAPRADRAGWFVTNYRYRLTHSLLNALDTCAPLTLRARDYCSAHRLSAWLRDKTQLGRGDLAAGMEHHLVHLPNLEGGHKLVQLPARAAELLTALHTPCLRSELSIRLMIAGSTPLTAQDDKHLALLRSLKAIAGAGA